MPETTGARHPMRVDGWRYAALPQAASFAEVLEELRTLFPPALLDGAGWERLLEHARSFPAAAAYAFGVDFPLDAPVPAIDISYTVHPGSPVAAHYIRCGRGEDPDSPATRLAACLVEQERGVSAAGAASPARWADRIVVTFDLVEPSPHPDPGPTVYLHVRRREGEEEPDLLDAMAAAAEPDQRAPAAVVPDQRAAAAEAAATAAAIVGWPADRQEQAAVERVFHALPPGAWMVFVGAMPGRDRSIRLVVGGVPPPEVPAFLERIAWPGSAQAVAALLVEIRDLPFEIMNLQLDVTARGPRAVFGVELGLGAVPCALTTGPEDWRELVERLVAKGRALPAKAQALLSWLGQERVFTNSGFLFIWKGLNHVKLTIRGEAVRTKAYPGMIVLGPGVEP